MQIQFLNATIPGSPSAPRRTSPVIAPWWQFVPFDLCAEVIPVRFTDHHYLHYTLQPMTAEQDDPARLLHQGEQLRSELESGANEPKTRPAKTPTSIRRSG